MTGWEWWWRQMLLGKKHPLGKYISESLELIKTTHTPGRFWYFLPIFGKSFPVQPVPHGTYLCNEPVIPIEGFSVQQIRGDEKSSQPIQSQVLKYLTTGGC